MQNLKLKTHLIKLSKKDRLYELDKPLVGLTGGIACGKSTVANMFKNIGSHVINADELIHRIYQDTDTKEFVLSLCPQAINNNVIDFKVLRSEFFNNNELKNKITNFLYAKLPSTFLQEVNAQKDKPFVIYDVPLLFENQLELKMDFTITVYVPQNIQIERLMERDQIEQDLAKQIIAAQMNIEDKRTKADFVIDNSGNLDALETKFQELTKNIFL